MGTAADFAETARSFAINSSTRGNQTLFTASRTVIA
jgi:hypothetical protein